jgi:hypothetical protein
MLNVLQRKAANEECGGITVNDGANGTEESAIPPHTRKIYMYIALFLLRNLGHQAKNASALTNMADGRIYDNGRLDQFAAVIIGR